MNVSFFISLKMTKVNAIFLLQADERIIFYFPENAISDFSLSNLMVKVKPDGSVSDDQLGDLVGPEYVPIQLFSNVILLQK